MATNFNAYPGGTEPDWALFDAIEIGPCQSVDGQTSGLDDPTEFDGNGELFWCVYGHYAPDSGFEGRESITDVPTEAEALSVADTYRARIGGAA